VPVLRFQAMLQFRRSTCVKNWVSISPNRSLITTPEVLLLSHFTVNRMLERLRLIHQKVVMER